jgi:hypothetical protein
MESIKLKMKDIIKNQGRTFGVERDHLKETRETTARELNDSKLCEGKTFTGVDIKTLGSGNCGEVFSAHSKTRKNFLIVKVLNDPNSYMNRGRSYTKNIAENMKDLWLRVWCQLSTPMATLWLYRFSMGEVWLGMERVRMETMEKVVQPVPSAEGNNIHPRHWVF